MKLNFLRPFFRAIVDLLEEWKDPEGLHRVPRESGKKARVLREKDILGIRGEKAAVRFLRKKGFRILAKNLHGTYGEIDVVARRKNLIIFVEVKTRDKLYWGDPMEAVKTHKRQNIIDTARAFIARSKLEHCSFRFDILSIIWEPNHPPVFEHYENAFDEDGDFLF